MEELKAEMLAKLREFGNASEPFDSIYAWIKEAPIELQLAEVQLAFAEARGGCYDNLDYV